MTSGANGVRRSETDGVSGASVPSSTLASEREGSQGRRQGKGRFLSGAERERHTFKALHGPWRRKIRFSGGQ